MAARKGQGNRVAAAPKEKGAPRKRKPFVESQVVVGQLIQALNDLGATVDGRFVEPEELQRAYNRLSKRKVAKENNPEWLRAQLERVTGKRVEIAGADRSVGTVGRGVEPGRDLGAQVTHYAESDPLADRVEAGYGE